MQFDCSGCVPFIFSRNEPDKMLCIFPPDIFGLGKVKVLASYVQFLDANAIRNT